MSSDRNERFSDLELARALTRHLRGGAGARAEPHGKASKLVEPRPHYIRFDGQKLVPDAEALFGGRGPRARFGPDTWNALLDGALSAADAETAFLMEAQGLVLAETTAQLRGGAQLTGIFLSHQDPDIVAAINGWLMTTDAVAYAPSVWKRFIPHFGLDRLVTERLRGVPDKGGFIELSGCKLVALPAHFLHSCGNLHLYDPVSRILYSGDMGASIGVPYLEVPDFDEHVPMIQSFHERRMASNAAMRLWAAMIRTLDVEMIAPQHGAFYRGKEMVGRFLDWAEGLSCGVDLLEHGYRVPTE